MSLNEKNTVPSRPAEGEAKPIRRRQRDLLARLCAYVDGHLSERLTLQTVAEAFDVSISTVTQQFQHGLGMTYHQYVTGRRMERARQLMEDGVPLEKIGRLVGYVDHSTFYRAFRQTYGISPREYRKIHKL